MKKTLALLISVLAIAGAAFAHEGKAHGKGKADAQMAKMHKMMPRYATSETAINAALEKGDAATVAKETDYLLTTTAELKKAKPHKKVKELKDFQRIAESFENDIKLTGELARKGEVQGAKAAFTNAQKWCSACHAEFKD